ncbi:MAG: hypothetical protein AAF649_08990 [Verrucomicrobiota bacterium]
MNLAAFLNRLYHWLGKPEAKLPEWSVLTRQHARCQILVRAFYAFLTFKIMFEQDIWPSLLGRDSMEPLWPVWWMGSGTPADLQIQCILYANLAAVLLVLMLPQFRSLRIFCFLAFLQYVAFRNSFGKINHWGHLLLFTSFLFIFLPAGWHQLNPQRTAKAATSLIIGSCIAVILTTYSMSGLGKIIVGILDAAQGQPNSFSPDSLARHVADRILETGQDSALGDIIVNAPLLGWPMMLATIYFQLASVFVIFRPELHRFWGAVHLLFHAGVYLTMTISFNNSVFMLALFLLASPFAPDTASPLKILTRLPCIGRIFSKFWVPNS